MSIRRITLRGEYSTILILHIIETRCIENSCLNKIFRFFTYMLAPVAAYDFIKIIIITPIIKLSN